MVVRDCEVMWGTAFCGSASKGFFRVFRADGLDALVQLPYMGCIFAVLNLQVALFFSRLFCRGFPSVRFCSFPTTSPFMPT